MAKRLGKIEQTEWYLLFVKKSVRKQIKNIQLTTVIPTKKERDMFIDTMDHLQDTFMLYKNTPIGKKLRDAYENILEAMPQNARYDTWLSVCTVEEFNITVASYYKTNDDAMEIIEFLDNLGL